MENNKTQFLSKPFYSFLKRTFDILFSFFLICFLLIPIVIIAICVKCSSPGPSFFKQERIGKNGKTFKMIKFRTMKVNAEKEGVYSNDEDPRITKIGKILRKTSIDEIPQLFNIFVGQMSFIGPRPPLTYHPWPLSEYDDRQLLMFKVRPGITGWAQINGRKTVKWPERIEMNVYYVLKRSILFDIKILCKTIVKVFKNEGNENIGETK